MLEWKSLFWIRWRKLKVLLGSAWGGFLGYLNIKVLVVAFMGKLLSAC